MPTTRSGAAAMESAAAALLLLSATAVSSAAPRGAETAPRRQNGRPAEKCLGGSYGVRKGVQAARRAQQPRPDP